MRLVAIAPIACLGALALAGCTITAQRAKDVATASLDVICTGVSPADIAFQTWRSSHPVNGTITKSERNAVVTITSVCNDWAVARSSGKPFNMQNGLRTASNAMAALVAANADAGVE